MTSALPSAQQTLLNELYSYETQKNESAVLNTIQNYILKSQDPSSSKTKLLLEIQKIGPYCKFHITLIKISSLVRGKASHPNITFYVSSLITQRAHISGFQLVKDFLASKPDFLDRISKLSPGHKQAIEIHKAQGKLARKSVDFFEMHPELAPWRYQKA